MHKHTNKQTDINQQNGKQNTWVCLCACVRMVCPSSRPPFSLPSTVGGGLCDAAMCATVPPSQSRMNFHKGHRPALFCSFFPSFAFFQKLPFSNLKSFVRSSHSSSPNQPTLLRPFTKLPQPTPTLIAHFLDLYPWIPPAHLCCYERTLFKGSTSRRSILFNFHHHARRF